LKALKNSPQEWIYHMIEVFNGGNIPAYEEAVKKHQKHIEANPVLFSNLHVLSEKIKIMALLELIFHLPKNDRNLQFQAVSKVTGLPQEHVEILVMKSMSLGLLKGTIDQVDALVKVTWIMPRVLDTNRIGIMREKIDQWKKGLDGIIRKIEKEDNKMIIE